MDHCNFVLTSLLCIILQGSVSGTTFTFVNKCSYTVWPGILGKPALDTSGFELPNGNSRSLQAPPGWSGRFWGRTGCTSDGSDHWSCATADCDTGEIQCHDAGATPPATLAEFTLGSGGPTQQDFYDVSLVDGYNLQMIVEASGGSGNCGTTGCVDDLNRRCPGELWVGGGGCRSACDAFGSPEYCCKGAFGTPESCRPTAYSMLFKAACPRSYSYAYDDATSTFTCSGADYVITFCPSLPSNKNTKGLTKPTNGSGSGTLDGLFSNSSLYADLALGRSTIVSHPSIKLVFISFIVYCIYILHNF